MFKDSPSQIFSKKSDKNSFFFREDLPFLIFLFSSFQEEHFCKQKKPDSLYFSLYCFCLICCLFRVVSLCLLSLLLLFKLTKNGKNKFLFYYSPSHIFHSKKIKFLLFGRIFLFFFLFSSIQEKHFCEQTPVLLVFRFVSLSLWKLFRIFKKNLSEFLCFSLLKFFSTFFRHFYLISFFLNSVSLPSLSSFSWTTISLVYQKTLQLSLFTCMRYLCMSFCSYICSSVVSFSLFVFSRFLYICFPFPSFVFSVNNLSERQVEGTVANLKKHVCLFTFLLGTFFRFICLCTMLCEEPDCIFNETCDALLFSFTFFFL